MITTTLAALSFDGDGTLWDFDAAMWLALEEAAAAFARAGLRHDGTPVTAAWLRTVRDEIAQQPDAARCSLEEVRLAAFRDAIRRCGSHQPQLATEIYDAYMQTRFSRLELFPDVHTALSNLGRRYSLAVVTNGNTVPARLGIEALFHVVVIASDCGYRKPDPAIFRYAIERLGVTPGECLHVGDDPVDDICAAHEAGLRTAWINRNGAAWTGPVDPDLVLGDLRELDALFAPRGTHRRGRRVPRRPSGPAR